MFIPSLPTEIQPFFRFPKNFEFFSKCSPYSHKSFGTIISYRRPFPGKIQLKMSKIENLPYLNQTNFPSNGSGAILKLRAWGFLWHQNEENLSVQFFFMTFWQKFQNFKNSKNSKLRGFQMAKYTQKIRHNLRNFLRPKSDLYDVVGEGYGHL